MKYILLGYILPMAIMLCYEVAAIRRAQRRRLMIRTTFWPMFCRCCIPALNLWLAMCLLLLDFNNLAEKFFKRYGFKNWGL